MATRSLERKQRLECELQSESSPRRIAGPEAGAEAEIARLRQCLAGAERETRTATGWARLMFALALTATVAAAILAYRPGETRLDNLSTQALLRAINEQGPLAATPAATSAVTPAQVTVQETSRPSEALTTPSPEAPTATVEPAATGYPAADPEPGSGIADPAAAASGPHPALARPTVPLLTAASGYSSFSTPGAPGANKPVTASRPDRDHRASESNAPQTHPPKGRTQKSMASTAQPVGGHRINGARPGGSLRHLARFGRPAHTNSRYRGSRRWAHRHRQHWRGHRSGGYSGHRWHRHHRSARWERTAPGYHHRRHASRQRRHARLRHHAPTHIRLSKRK